MKAIKRNTLSGRMKTYEACSDIRLTQRMPVIVRIDGKAFHTFTRGCTKPFDIIFSELMGTTAKKLCENIQGCKLAFTQSDEISLLLTDYDDINSQGFFDYRLEKITSVTASMATLFFNQALEDLIKEQTIKNSSKLELWESKRFKALFDSRTFNVPKEDVNNYFLWRQQDATKNSILSVAQYYFSQKEMTGKKCSELQEMLWQQKNINWNDYSVPEKRGTCIIKTENGWKLDYKIPIFSKDTDYINKLVFLPEEI